MPQELGSRERILSASIREFSSHGYAGARVERVAKAANANKQLIYYYFGSKSGLYAAALEETVAGLIGPQGIGADQAGPDRVRRELQALAGRMSKSTPSVALILRALLEAGANEHPRRLVDGVLRTLTDAISEGQGIGYFRDEADPAALAWAACALVFGDAILRMTANPLDGTPSLSGQHVSGLVLRALEW